MSKHEHPYDLVFTGDLEAQLDEIKSEASERGVDVSDPDRLVMLVSAGDVLKSLLPDDASLTAIQQVGRLLFYSFHFRAAGKATYEIPETVLRELLSNALIGGAHEIRPPGAAGYVALPRNRVWSRITEDSHAEAIDGFFFAGDDVLYVLGLMRGRPGFSIMEVQSTQIPGGTTSVAELKAREEGADFANVLPGGELQGHFAITNNVEALKLAARCFWHLSHRG
jgi:hypothetical protein